MRNFFLLLLLPVVSLVFVLIFTPIARAIAIKVKLVDKPNARKVHHKSTPLVGGLVIFASVGLTLLLGSTSVDFGDHLHILAVGSTVLLAIGLVDDRWDLRASYKLMVQIAVAYFVFASGIRLSSFFGIFGIEAVPEYLQYILTILIIVGTVNAFNLTDGIDGLAGGLAFLASFAYALLAFLLHRMDYVAFFLVILGALLGFLRYNLSDRSKIFMGDAGSLVLGFVLVVSGLSLIETATDSSLLNLTISVVIGVLVLPVLDSLRVYRNRIKRGESPFKADRTHFHHLVLALGLKHKLAAMLVIVVALLIVMIAVLVGGFFSITLSIIALLLFFAGIASFLLLHQEVVIWGEKIKDLERN